MLELMVKLGPIYCKKIITLSNIGALNTLIQQKFDLVKFHCYKVKSVFNLINSPMAFHKAKAAFSQWKLTE